MLLLSGGATHLDIACDPELVRVAKREAGPSFPVMVSAIDPKVNREEACLLVIGLTNP